MKMTSKAQPYCPFCAKPLRKWTRMVALREPPKEGSQNFRGSDWIIRLLEIPRDQWPKTKAECQRHSNQQVVSVKYDRQRNITSFGEWDGESYDCAAGVFCTTGCAAAFGLAAYRAGYRGER